jgi:hypothetical protein
MYKTIPCTCIHGYRENLGAWVMLFCPFLSLLLQSLMGRLQRSPFGKGKEVERNGMHMKEWLRGNTDSYRFFSKAHFFVLPKLE